LEIVKVIRNLENSKWKILKKKVPGFDPPLVVVVVFLKHSTQKVSQPDSSSC
jgi:hypothetical protein